MAPSAPDAPSSPPVFYETPIAETSGVSPAVIVISIVLILLIGMAVAASLYLRNQSKPKVEAQKAAAVAAQPAPEDSYIRALNLGNYPAATPVAIVTLNGETVLAGFVTRDRPDQVMQYYRVRLPISDVTTENAASHLSATLPNHQRIRIDAEPQGTNTQVKIVRVQ
jgi:hypothetical protein